MRRKLLPFFELLVAVASSLFILTGSYYAPGGNASLAVNDATSLPAKRLTVITHDSYHTYFQHKIRGADGLAFQMVSQFARENNYQLNIVIAPHIDDIYQALDEGVADIGLVGHPLSLSRQVDYPQSLPYMNVTTELIYRHGTGRPETFEELSGRTIVLQDNEQLREKQRFIQAHYPDINWKLSKLSVEELVGMVNSGAIDYTLVDSHDYLSIRALYSKTREAFPIYYPEPLSLALSTSAHAQLAGSLDQYITAIKSDGSLDQWLERFYGHAHDTNPRGSRTFFSRVNNRLPKYQDLIQEIAEEYNIDWRLLAAVAYQESHWNPKAKSPTGVRGMMMLTLETSKLVGVSNRLDAEQSLRGGAKYLQSVMMRLPESIKQPDRTWFALASYNVGLGHVLDVREITEFHGGNPDRWVDIKKYLPLLEREEWHQFTRYGYARGNEPVGYVQNIRHFRDLLEWRFPDKHTAPVKNTAIASIRPLEEARQAAHLKELDPSLQPVRLSALIQ